MARYKGDIGAYLSGGPVLLKECGMYVRPPSIKDIMLYGENDFLLDTKVFTMDETLIRAVKDNEPRFKDEEPWIILCALVSSDKTMAMKFKKYLTLVVPDFESSFDNGNLLFKDSEGVMRGRIQQFNYESFSVTLKELFLPQSDKDGDAYNPVNSKAAEIAEKLKKGREAANKSKKGSSGDDNSSLFGLYASSLSVGLGMDINVLLTYTPFQIYDAFDRYVKKSEYDIYMKIQTTPMMSTENMDEPQHWMSNLYNN